MFIASNVENNSSKRTRFKRFFISWLHANSAPGPGLKNSTAIILPSYYRPTFRMFINLFIPYKLGAPFNRFHCGFILDFISFYSYRLQVRLIRINVPQFAQLKVCDIWLLAPNIFGSLNFMGQGPTGEGIWSSFPNQVNDLYF